MARSRVNGAQFRSDLETVATLREHFSLFHSPAYEPYCFGKRWLSDAHRAFIQPLLESLLGPIGEVMTHLSLKNGQTELDREQRWCRGFPHIHHWDNAATLIHFLAVPEGGGEFVWIDDEGEHEVTPEVGLIVACDGHTSHGVRPVLGTQDRIALITTGWAA